MNLNLNQTEINSNSKLKDELCRVWVVCACALFRVLQFWYQFELIIRRRCLLCLSVMILSWNLPTFKWISGAKMCVEKNLLHSLCLIVLVGSRRYLQGKGVSVLCNVSMSKCQNSKAGAGLVVSITTASSHYLYLPWQPRVTRTWHFTPFLWGKKWWCCMEIIIPYRCFGRTSLCQPAVSLTCDQAKI